MKKAPCALVILDGFGYSPISENNAIAQAKKPTLDYLMQHYSHCLLHASGQAVGLPEGTEGNSEVGHITLGAGRIVPSAFLHFSKAIADGSFFTNPVLRTHLQKIAQEKRSLHIIGLLSSASSQCSMQLIKALIQAAATEYPIKKIIVHAILDGRDTPLKAASIFLQEIENYIKPYKNVSLGSITGRFYAMDRDKDWDRTKKAYDMLIGQTPVTFDTWQTALDSYYSNNITDEFIPPTLVQPQAYIHADDGVIFANFREDRARQLAACFLEPKTMPVSIAPVLLSFFITAIRYEKQFNNPVLYESAPVNHTLKEILSTAGKTIFSIAETEKYAHVTYFFSDGIEQPFAGEQWTLIHSLPVKNYAQAPAMSAQKITDEVIHSLQTNPADFYLINYANADMVGHTGNFAATIKAIEYLDNQIRQLYDIIIKKMHGSMIITADHGNAEYMFDVKTGQPYPGHTTNPVPFLYINNENTKIPLHGLADVAPFILKQFGLPVPKEMTGDPSTGSG